MNDTKNNVLFRVLQSIWKNFWLYIGILTFVCFIAGCFFILAIASKSSSFSQLRGGHSKKVKEGSILALQLEGMIVESSEFIDDLNEYIKDDKIKGVLIRINSPGGGVTPSEEIYREILRVKELYKKPIVISIGSLGASGAFYVAMAGDKVIANESSLLGSIGVIIYLSNLEELYEWAKIQHYVIKTGEFKDSGSNFRPLTPRERDLYQDLIDQLLAQFKEAIVESRSLSVELVDEFSDGRVFLGGTALVQGFIDQVGTYYEALKLIGEMTGLGEDPKVFEPPEKFENLWKEILFSSLSYIFPFSRVKNFHLIPPQLNGRPLYIMPEHVGL